MDSRFQPLSYMIECQYPGGQMQWNDTIDSESSIFDNSFSGIYLASFRVMSLNCIFEVPQSCNGIFAPPARAFHFDSITTTATSRVCIRLYTSYIHIDTGGVVFRAFGVFTIFRVWGGAGGEEIRTVGNRIVNIRIVGIHMVGIRIVGIRIVLQ